MLAHLTADYLVCRSCVWESWPLLWVSNIPRHIPKRRQRTWSKFSGFIACIL